MPQTWRTGISRPREAIHRQNIHHKARLHRWEQTAMAQHPPRYLRASLSHHRHKNQFSPRLRNIKSPLARLLISNHDNIVIEAQTARNHPREQVHVFYYVSPEAASERHSFHTSTDQHSILHIDIGLDRARRSTTFGIAGEPSPSIRPSSLGTDVGKGSR